MGNEWSIVMMMTMEQERYEWFCGGGFSFMMIFCDRTKYDRRIKG